MTKIFLNNKKRKCTGQKEGNNIALTLILNSQTLKNSGAHWVHMWLTGYSH